MIRSDKTQKFPLLPFLLIIVLLFTVGIGYSQDKDEQEQEPDPILTSEIISESEKLNTDLNRMSELLTPDEDVQRIEQEYSDYRKSLNTLKKKQDLGKIERYSLRKIEDIRQKWIIHKNKLAEWLNKLQTRSENIESERLQLNEIKAIWQISNRDARDEEAPRQLLTTIQKNIREINDKETQFRQRLDKIIALQNKITEQEAMVNDIIATIDKIKAGKQSAIFTLDSVPIWQVFTTADTTSKISDHISDTIASYSDSFRDFTDTYLEAIIKHISIFLIILIFLILLRFFGNIMIMDQESAQLSSAISSHPFSVAFLVFILLTNTMYPQAPGIISDLAIIASLFPIFILLPVFYALKIRRILAFFLIILLLDLLDSFFPEESATHRFTLLILSSLSLVYIWWILFAKFFEESTTFKRYQELARFILGIMIFFMATSIFSNLIGNVALARVLTSGSLLSIYFAVILMAGTKVVFGLINLILSTKFAFFSRIVRLYPQKTRSVISKVINIAAIYIWIVESLDNYSAYDFLAKWISDILLERWQIGSVDISIGDILLFIATILLAIYISRFIRFVLEQDILSRMRMPRGVPTTISMLTNYAIITLGFIIAISAAGIDLSKLAILLGALGVGIGFGLQNIVNNFFSGLILIFERPVQVGDVVEIESLLGTVKRIGIRSSTIRTFDGAEVIVPNANLISNEVTNWTLSDKYRRITINVGTAYGTDPNLVLKILKQTIKKNKEILETPEPLFLFEEFGDSSLNFSIRFWTGTSEWLNLKSNVTVAINNAFNKAGIEIPFPQHDLHLRSVNPAILKTQSEKATKMAGDTKPKKDVKSSTTRKKGKSN